MLDFIDLPNWMFGPAVLAGIVFIFIVLPYSLLPILVKATQKFRVQPSVFAFDPAVNVPPPDVARFFHESVQRLLMCGFGVIVHGYMPDLLANVKVVFVLLGNPKTNDAALVAVVHATQDSLGGMVRIQEQHVEFSTDFQDGTEVSTTNTKEESAFAPVPHKRLLQFDGVVDPADLYQIHCRATMESKSPKKVLSAAESILAAFSRAVTKEFSDQIPTGFIQLQPSGEFYVPTWKGAYLMTWKQLQPVKYLRRLKRKRRKRELLAQWGLSIPLTS